MPRTATGSSDIDKSLDPAANYARTMNEVGYVPKSQATRDLYTSLGFKCGLEIHQQLMTVQKLFCHCPAGVYQKDGEFDAEIIRHMRPTLSEMGEYDGTALMEKKTKKTIIYRIRNDNACTYDIDDTPPFKINHEALTIALENALLLKTSIVGELHITRKQYLDGSIPTGFQRTAIVGIEGEIPLREKKVRIIQISIEEDSCREVSDVGHLRVYTTDRLGMPLIETVTYPEMLTPDEAAEAGQYLRCLTRSTGKVRTGIGAARQDVNVSITGGTRVEIKGVAHIQWIPVLTHNEAFRQKALLRIKSRLNETIPDTSHWTIGFKHVDTKDVDFISQFLPENRRDDLRIVAVNLPGFNGILSHFTQSGKTFANELSDRLKVIACIDKPNLIHSEEAETSTRENFASVCKLLDSGTEDAQLLIWGPREDMETALETIEERCRLAFNGVPDETRKALPDGTTIFERVLPGPDRMYPDTDSAPIPIENDFIETVRKNLPTDLYEESVRLRDWKIPEDTHAYLLRNHLGDMIDRIALTTGWPQKFVGTLLGQSVRSLFRHGTTRDGFDYDLIEKLCRFVAERRMNQQIVKELLPLSAEQPQSSFESLLESLALESFSIEDVRAMLPKLAVRFEEIRKSRHPRAKHRWIMGQLRNRVMNSMPLAVLATMIEESVQDG